MKIILNIYDLHSCNDVFGFVGLGLYHTGIQVDNVEYSYGHADGIFTHYPMKAPGAVFRESVELGTYEGNREQLDSIVDKLDQKYCCDNYNLLYQNCNTFSNELVECLLGRGIPDHVNRLAAIGQMFSFLLPASITNNYQNNSLAFGDSDKLTIDNKQYKII